MAFQNPLSRFTHAYFHLSFSSASPSSCPAPARPFLSVIGRRPGQLLPGLPSARAHHPYRNKRKMTTGSNIAAALSPFFATSARLAEDVEVIILQRRPRRAGGPARTRITLPETALSSLEDARCKIADCSLWSNTRIKVCLAFRSPPHRYHPWFSRVILSLIFDTRTLSSALFPLRPVDRITVPGV